MNLMIFIIGMSTSGLGQDSSVNEYENIINSSVISDYEKIIKLNEFFEFNSNGDIADKILIEIGKIALKMEVTINEYNENLNLKNICHMKIGESGNYGDFIGYDGYHFKKILSEYNNSASIPAQSMRSGS